MVGALVGADALCHRSCRAPGSTGKRPRWRFFHAGSINVRQSGCTAILHSTKRTAFSRHEQPGRRILIDAAHQPHTPGRYHAHVVRYAGGYLRVCLAPVGNPGCLLRNQPAGISDRWSGGKRFPILRHQPFERSHPGSIGDRWCCGLAGSGAHGRACQHNWLGAYGWSFRNRHRGIGLHGRQRNQPRHRPH